MTKNRISKTPIHAPETQEILERLVLGKGLIAAVLFKNPETGEPDGAFTSQVAELCMQKGLLVVHTGRESIKIGPPLTISDEALLEGVDVLGESIQGVVAR